MALRVVRCPASVIRLTLFFTLSATSVWALSLKHLVTFRVPTEIPQKQAHPIMGFKAVASPMVGATTDSN